MPSNKCKVSQCSDAILISEGLDWSSLDHNLLCSFVLPTTPNLFQGVWLESKDRISEMLLYGAFQIYASISTIFHNVHFIHCAVPTPG